MLFIAGPVVLLLLVGAAYMMVLKPKPVVDEKALAKEPGPVYSMPEDFVVNLVGSDGTPHFAKVGVALRLSELDAIHLGLETGGGHGAAPEEPVPIEQDPEIRDIVIATLQKKSTHDLATPHGREVVKKQIVKEVNGHTDLHILDVYYTEFAVQ